MLVARGFSCVLLEGLYVLVGITGTVRLPVPSAVVTVTGADTVVVVWRVSCVLLEGCIVLVVPDCSTTVMSHCSENKIVHILSRGSC